MRQGPRSDDMVSFRVKKVCVFFNPPPENFDLMEFGEPDDMPQEADLFGVGFQEMGGKFRFADY